MKSRIILTLLLFTALTNVPEEQQTIEWQDVSQGVYCHGYHVGGRLAQKESSQKSFLLCDPPEEPGNYLDYLCVGVVNGYIGHKQVLYGGLWEGVVNNEIMLRLKDKCLREGWWKNYVFIPQPLVIG